MKNEWWVSPAGQDQQLFANFAAVEALPGEVLSQTSTSRLVKSILNGKTFYIKFYFGGRDYFRDYFGRSRARAEWENLRYFNQLGINAPKIVAFGEEKKRGRFFRGVLITEEVRGARDLVTLTKEEAALFHDRHWLDEVMKTIADYARKLHQRGFIHTDLKWRNILVTKSAFPQVYLIDCPAGAKKRGIFLRHGIIKDLACLDKKGKYQLSRTERLRFYLYYARLSRLTARHKRKIRKILAFFEGRE